MSNDTRTLTLTEFLLDQIANDEANASCEGWGEYESCSDWSRRREAECEAKRRIVELHKDWPVLVEAPPRFEQNSGDDINSMTFRMSKQIMWTTEQEYRNRFGSEPPTGPILRALAVVYADHPDYREEWRP